MNDRRRLALLAALVAALSAAAYLAAAGTTLRLGFPLDDAWIHQVYARNLVQHGEWAFRVGEPSAGSTAPLWAAYLALGYLFRLPHLLWAYLGGVALLAAAGWLGGCWLAARLSGRRQLAWIAAAALPLEWHLVWAALSGMETLSLGALALLVCWLSERRRLHPAALGGLIGMGVWLRPEALLLLCVPVGQILFRARSKRLRPLIELVLGLALPLAGYLLFQHSFSGEWWPNTFFAKQAEYVELRSLPLLTRLLAQLGVPGAWIGAPELAAGGPLVGVLLVLLPGLALSALRDLRSRRWSRLLPLGWSLLHLASYATRLPVTYQHGRYAMPVLPVLIVLSLDGMLGGLDFGARRGTAWVLGRAWPAAAALTAIAFWGLGRSAYGRDVAVIESEMVQTAKWLELNTPPAATIAAHDIGALGYFAQRPLLDLAGLVSPEVIPFIRDQAVLGEYLDQAGAAYLMTFPGWYPRLVAGHRLLYQSQADYSPDSGGENMAVYEWKSSLFAP